MEYVTLRTLKHNRKFYPPGSTVDLDPATADLTDGAVEPKAIYDAREKAKADTAAALEKAKADAARAEEKARADIAAAKAKAEAAANAEAKKEGK